MNDSIYDWSVTADDNQTADSAINLAEYQPPSTINNAVRAVMGRVSAWLKDLAPNVTSSGSVNAYVITSAAGGGGTGTYRDGEIIEFFPHLDNTAAATINRDGRGAVPLRPVSGVEFQKSDIVTGVAVRAAYRLATNEFIAPTLAYAFRKLAPSFMQSNTFGLSVGDIKISTDDTGPAPGFVRLGETITFLSKATYPDLNAYFSARSYPHGSTSTTFGIPQAAGYTLRFAATTAAVDPSGPRTAGSLQQDAIKNHTHPFSGTTGTDYPDHTHWLPSSLGGTFGPTQGGSSNIAGGGTSSGGASARHQHNFSGTTGNQTGGSTETRGKNVAYYADMLAVPALVASGLIGVSGFAYKWSTSTGTANPGSGYVGINNASAGSATELYINETDANGTSLAALLAQLPGNTGLYITKVGAPQNWIWLRSTNAPTDNGAWDTITVTGGASAGTIASGDAVSVVVHIAGQQGVQGITGSDGGTRFAFDGATTMGAPSAGGLRFNAASLGSATAIAIAPTCAEVGNPSVANWIRSWDDSTTIGHCGTLMIRSAMAAENFVILNVLSNVTDNATWLTATVAVIEARGAFSAADTLLVSFYRTGDRGQDGVGAGTVTSVNVAMPGYTSSGAVSSAGVVTMTANEVGKNLVQAGPATGANASPAYRTLVMDDLPSSGIAPGTYKSLTVNAHGVATAGTSVTAALPTTQEFTAPGTWTRPDGCVLIRARGTGAGAGSGGVTGGASMFAAAAGGGAGTEFDVLIDVTNIPSSPVTIGAGGTAGGVGTAGGSGGATSFGSYVTAPGGSGGQPMAAGTAAGTMAAAGLGGGAATKSADPAVRALAATTGAPGQPGLRISGVSGLPGAGGSSRYGGGGRPGAAAGPGEAGTGYGSGASGARSNTATGYPGAAGRGGYMMIEEYYG